MKNTTILFMTFALVLVIGSFVFVNMEASAKGEIIVKNAEIIEGEMQKVILSMKDFNYYPSEVRVKVGEPVELTLDDSVQGCLRAFTIRDLGVNKYSKNAEDKIVFTPAKKGKFKATCTMSMGYMDFIVE